MTQDAQRQFRAVCNSRLFEVLSFGTIKYDTNKKHITKRGYDTRGTFISYNTSSKQFEKHPAGWVTLSSDEKPINAFLSMIKSKTDDVMANFASRQCTK